MDLYKILGVDINSTDNEIKKAYFKLAKIYHPDKNKTTNTEQKFHSINYAYTILIDKENRKKYNEMNFSKKNEFHLFLQKIFKSELNVDELDAFGIKISNEEYDYLKNKFSDLIEKYNIIEIINLFNDNTIIKKEESVNICSDSEVNNWDEESAEYYGINQLPVKYQKYNKNNIMLNLNVNLNDIINCNSRRITIKRKLDDRFKKTIFEFYPKHPYIIFNEGGDIDSENIGNLIIKLNLPKEYTWGDEIIYYNYNITLYQFIYHNEFQINFNEEDLLIKWIPYRDGNIVKLNLKTQYYNFEIKFNIIFDIKKEYILKEYFN